MKKISFITIGENELDLTGTGPQRKEENKNEKTDTDKTEKVTVETSFETTSEIPKKDMVELPKEVLDALIAMAKKQQSGGGSNVDEKFIKALDRLTDATRDAGTGEDRFIGVRPVSMEDIDRDDLMTTPSLFFAYSYAYTVWDDKKFGRTINAPYGAPIKFKMIQRTVDRAIPRSPKFVTVSSTVVYSKKVYNFLKEHSLLGIKFFESANEVRELTASLAEMISIAYGSVQNYTEQEVIVHCRAETITIDTQDVQELRRRLSLKRAKRMMQDGEHKNKKQAQLAAEWGEFEKGNVPFVTDGTTDPSTGNQDSKQTKGPQSQPY